MLLIDSREHRQRGMTMAGSLLKLNSGREAAADIDRPIAGKPPQDHWGPTSNPSWNGTTF